jgi:hypothetical protein
MTSANKAAVKLCGFSRKEFLRMTIFQVPAPEYHQTFRQSLQSLAEGRPLPPLLMASDWRKGTPVRNASGRARP